MITLPICEKAGAVIPDGKNCAASDITDRTVGNAAMRNSPVVFGSGALSRVMIPGGNGFL
jgi:hypothetical protein